MHGSVRKRVVTGFLVLIPISVTIFVLRLAYSATAAVLSPLIRVLYADLPELAVGLISVLVLVAILYVVGVCAAVFGEHQWTRFAEGLLARIPLVKTIYTTAKQVVSTLSTSHHRAFKSVVLVEYPRVGIYAIAFVTGRVRNDAGAEFCTLFIPTSPNPTSGVLVFAPCAEVVDAGMSVEDGLKMVVSGGIIGPNRLNAGVRAPSSEPQCPAGG